MSREDRVRPIAEARAGVIETVERIPSRIRAWLPRGQSLPGQAWPQRHRGIVVLLWLHSVALTLFGLAMGVGRLHSVEEGGVIAGTALLASFRALNRRLRAVLASLGLVASSAILVHLSGGYIEMHFHFFMMLAVIALYQDCIPFLAAIGFVAGQHGLMGVLDPDSVYNHSDAIAAPWTWAGIHAAFVLAASAASVVNWRLHERARARMD